MPRLTSYAHQGPRYGPDAKHPGVQGNALVRGSRATPWSGGPGRCPGPGGQGSALDLPRPGQRGGNRECAVCPGVCLPAPPRKWWSGGQKKEVRLHVAPQISVGNEAYEAAFLVHDPGGAEAFAGDGQNRFGHFLLRAHQGNGVARVHEVAHRHELHAQAAAGVILMKIFRGEAPGLQKTDGQGVAQGRHHGAGSGGRAAYGAGFRYVRQQEDDSRLPGQKAFGIFGDADHGNLVAGAKSQDGFHLHGFAGIGIGQDQVAGGDHAQIAVGGLRRVDEIGRGAGGGQSGGHFFGDVPALAHAGHGDSPLKGQNQLHRPPEIVVQVAGQNFQAFGFGFQNGRAFGQNI